MNTKPVLYLSGPMTGIENKNYIEFTYWTSKLRRAGYIVVNPWELDNAHPTPTWEDSLRRDIIAMMTCDGVATLNGWKKSRGANLEVGIAQGLGWPVQSVRQWLKKEKE